MLTHERYSPVNQGFIYLLISVLTPLNANHQILGKMSRLQNVIFSVFPTLTFLSAQPVLEVLQEPSADLEVECFLTPSSLVLHEGHCGSEIQFFIIITTKQCFSVSEKNKIKVVC